MPGSEGVWLDCDGLIVKPQGIDIVSEGRCDGGEQEQGGDGFRLEFESTFQINRGVPGSAEFMQCVSTEFECGYIVVFGLKKPCEAAESIN